MDSKACVKFTMHPFLRVRLKLSYLFSVVFQCRSRFTSAVVYQGLVMRLGIIGGNLYIDFFISGVVELPGALLILLTIERLGRRLPFAASNIVAGVACLVTAFLPEGNCPPSLFGREEFEKNLKSKLSTRGNLLSLENVPLPQNFGTRYALVMSFNFLFNQCNILSIRH